VLQGAASGLLSAEDLGSMQKIHDGFGVALAEVEGVATAIELIYGLLHTQAVGVVVHNPDKLAAYAVELNLMSKDEYKGLVAKEDGALSNWLRLYTRTAQNMQQLLLAMMLNEMSVEKVRDKYSKTGFIGDYSSEINGAYSVYTQRALLAIAFDGRVADDMSANQVRKLQDIAGAEAGKKKSMFVYVQGLDKRLQTGTLKGERHVMMRRRFGENPIAVTTELFPMLGKDVVRDSSGGTSTRGTAERGQLVERGGDEFVERWEAPVPTRGMDSPHKLALLQPKPVVGSAFVEPPVLNTPSVIPGFSEATLDLNSGIGVQSGDTTHKPGYGGAAMTRPLVQQREVVGVVSNADAQEVTGIGDEEIRSAQS